MVRVLQWVVLVGSLARGHGHDALRQAGADDLRPRRAPRRNPATPSARKRSRQRETFFGVMDRPAAISLTCWLAASVSRWRPIHFTFRASS